MIYQRYAVGLLVLAVMSCANDAGDSVQKADSINRTRMDTTAGGVIGTDSASSSLLVFAANADLSNIELGELAREKGHNRQVVNFGTIMVHDHSDIFDKVKKLAREKEVALPDGISEEKKSIVRALSEMSSRDFDRAYIKNMIAAHEEEIRKFENAAQKVVDSDIKVFVENTLPTLRKHLDAALTAMKEIQQ